MFMWSKKGSTKIVNEVEIYHDCACAALIVQRKQRNYEEKNTEQNQTATSVSSEEFKAM